jgi:DAK2 domain fusion protein YloV
MGARGNSGVILSQIIRGAMEVLGQSGSTDAAVLVQALRHATDTAYRAVRKPVEGTMLTVLREMAEAAAGMEASSADVTTLVQKVIEAGWKSVERTPTLLKVLADAGVVDAGGYGLVVFLEGAAVGEAEWEAPIRTHLDESTLGETGWFAEEESAEESQYTYCTSFLLRGVDLDRMLLERRLGLLGDSLLVVGDSGQLKVHVHTNDPGEVLSIGTSLGVLTAIEIDNMREQTAARAERLAASGGQYQPEEEPPLTQVVAVVAGEGNKRLFRNLGVELLVDGGQSMNPSAQDLMRAVDKASAPTVIILPNNSNVIMTAEQAAKLTERRILVLPSRSVQAGLSAAVAFDRRRPGDEIYREMQAALAGVVTGEVTRAVRDSLADGVQVKADDFIGLVEERVVCSSTDIQVVVACVVQKLLEGGREMLTALIGEGEDAPQAIAAVEAMRAAYPEVEIEVHEGGQPFYPLLLSAE